MGKTRSTTRILDRKPLSVGDWVIKIMVFAIPLLIVVLYFYSALSSSVSLNRRNYWRASWIFWPYV